MTKEDIIKHIEEANNVAHTICIPIDHVMSIQLLEILVKEARKANVEVRMWHETSNFYQGVLVQLQRFHDRIDCTPFAMRNGGKKS